MLKQKKNEEKIKNTCSDNKNNVNKANNNKFNKIFKDKNKNIKNKSQDKKESKKLKEKNKKTNINPIFKNNIINENTKNANNSNFKKNSSRSELTKIFKQNKKLRLSNIICTKKITKTNIKQEFLSELTEDATSISDKYAKTKIIISSNKTYMLYSEKEKINNFLLISKRKNKKYSFYCDKDISNYYNIFSKSLLSKNNSFYYSVKYSVKDNNKYSIGSLRETNNYILNKYPSANISCSNLFQKKKSIKYESFNISNTKKLTLDEIEKKFISNPLNYMYIQNLIINSHYISFNGYYKNSSYNRPYQGLSKNYLENSRQKSRFNTSNISVNIKKLIKNNQLKETSHYNPLFLLLKYNEDESSFKNKSTTPNIKKPKNKDIYILKKKNFFDNSFINYKSKNHRDVMLGNVISDKQIYHYLSSLLVNGKTDLFLEFFEKNRNRIDIDKQGHDGITLLINAVKDGNNVIVRHLCERGADVNIRDNKGNTALHYAIGMKFFDIADILNNYGAREDILNCDGCSPWNASFLGI